jgi:hypothetical protein
MGKLSGEPVYRRLGQAVFGVSTNTPGQPRNPNKQTSLQTRLRKSLPGQYLSVDTTSADDIILLGSLNMGRT